MKFDLSQFDENAIKIDQKGPISIIWKIREVIKESARLQKESQQNEANEESRQKLAETEAEFLSLLQKLVKSPLIQTHKLQIQHLKDIFNAVSDRIEKFKDSEDKSTLLTLLQVESLISTYNPNQERVDSIKVINDILYGQEDLRIIVAALEVINQVAFKRQQEYSEKVIKIAMAPNLLRSKENHFTLLEIACGQNSKGEKLTELDLIFEVEQAPLGLNDKSTSKAVTIPRSEIINSELSAAKLSKQLASQYGKETDKNFVTDLEIKIAYMRFELMIKVVSNIMKIIQKDQGAYISMDLITKSQPSRSSEDDQEKPLIVKLVADLASVRTVEDGIMINKEARTQVINSSVIKSSFFQFNLITLISLIMRILQSQHHRSSSVYQDLVNSIMDNLLKIIEEPNVLSFSTYTYHPKVTQQVCLLIKMGARPRIEEQFEIVKKLENRIIQETESIFKPIGLCQDEEDISDELELKDRQLITKQLISILSDMITRDHISLVGTICSENPGNTPNLIKSGLLPQILNSLTKRIPVSTSTLESLVQSFNAFSIQQEGQDLVIASQIFKKLLDQTITSEDPKMYHSLINQDHMMLKIYLGNLFDRNQSFKDSMRESLTQNYLEIIRKFVIDQTIFYLETIRREDLSTQEKQEELAKIKSLKGYSQVIAAINMVNNISFLSTDNMNQSRHTIDIIQQDVFNKIMEIFEMLGQVPSLDVIHNSYKKIIKALVDHLNFIQNFQSYVTKFENQITNLQAVLGKQIYLVESFDFSEKTIDKELPPLSSYNPEQSQDYLHKGESLLFQVSLVYTYVKTTQFLHGATQQQLIQRENLQKLTKPVFYLLRIIQKIRNQVFLSFVEEIEKDSSEEFKFLLKPQSKEASPAEKRELTTKLKSFFNIQIEKRYQVSNIFTMKESVLQDYFHKISNYSFQQLRHADQRKALEKNLHFIGKLLYKISKQVSKKNLEKKLPSIEKNNLQVLQQLYWINQNLTDLHQFTIRGWLDGAAFFQFFKKGGINNMIECFQYLGELLPVINEEWDSPYIYLLDDSSQKLKEFLLLMINTRNSENHLNSLITMNMGSDFDSPKNLYQTFYNVVCQNLLPLNQQQESNPILKYSNQRNPYLQDVIMILLQQASKSFQGCQLLKESGRQAARNQGRNQADPVQVETLLGMGFGFTRERVQQALLQAHNNLDNAFNILLDLQMQNQLGIDQALDEEGGLGLNDDGLSSQESQEENPSSSLLVLDQKMTDLTIPKPRKIQKVDEKTFSETVKKTQQQGFTWMIDALKSEEVNNQNKFRDFLSSIMLNEKEEASQKSMYSQVAVLFKKNVIRMNAAIEEKIMKMKDSEQQMSEIDTSTQSKNKEIISSIQQVLSDISLISKVISNNKSYFKEGVLRASLYLECMVLLTQLLDYFNTSLQPLLIEDDQLNGLYQKAIQDIVILCFQVYQLTQLQISLYTSQKAQGEAYQKKIQFYNQKVNTQTAIQVCFKYLDSYISQQTTESESQKCHLKKALITTVAALTLRLLMNKDLDQGDKQQHIQQLFSVISGFKESKIVENKILSSVSIMNFENSKSLQVQMEKLIQRTLWLKYEYESKINKNTSDSGHLLSKAGFNNFLAYFTSLSTRDPQGFKKILSEQCEIKTIKKLNTLSQDQAVIRLKESVFNEVKKQVLKEREVLKKHVKSIDFVNDKALKTQSKISKKALLGQLTDSQQAVFQGIISQITERTTSTLDDFNSFNTLTSQQQKLLVSKSQLKPYSGSEDQQLMETLCKLCQAYPAATVTILKSQPQPKKTFFNWFIREFLVTQLLNRQTKPVKAEEEGSQDQISVSFSLKTATKSLDSFVFRALNTLTAYNHLMTLNEQLVKHELRTKFILEALSSLQKAIKDKASTNQLKQKCLILSSLSVLEALLNFDQASKQSSLAQENFANSMRAAVLREASTKDANLPPSFIKLADELMSEVIDVTLGSNADIINKCVNILKYIAEFLNNERKKEDLSILKHTEESKQEEEKQVAEQMQIIPDGMQDEIDQEPDDDEQINDNAEEQNQDEDDEEDNDDEDEDLEEPNLYPEEEEDDEDMEIDVPHQDDGQDLFEEEEDDDDVDDLEEEEVIIQGRLDGQRRGQQLPDIINLDRQEQNRPQYYARMHPQAQEARIWSEEEAQVQRILGQMRQSQQLLMPAANDRPQLHRGGIPPPAQHLNWFPYPGENHPPNNEDQHRPGLGFIDQIFDGLKTMSEKELLEIVNGQRSALELEIKEDMKNSAQSNEKLNFLLEIINNARSNIQNPQSRIQELDEVINEDFNAGIYGDPLGMPLQLRNNVFGDIMIHGHNDGPQRIIVNPFMDPMFARPNPFIANEGLFRGRWDEPLLQPPHPAQEGLNIAENVLFSQYQRTLQQSQANQNEGLGQQILENITVNFEEQKEEQPKKADESVVSNSPRLVSQPRRSSISGVQSFQSQMNAPANQNPWELSSAQLLDSIFGNRPQVVEEQSERVRMEERSRSLREEIDRQQQDIQNIVSEQQRQAEEQLANLQVDQPLQEPEMIQQQVFQEQIVQEPVQEAQPVQAVDEVKEVPQVQEEEKKEVAESQQQPKATTFGYDNELLLEHGIDPEILHELPEELRAELLSTIDIQMPSREEQKEQPSVANQEEEKQPEGQQQQQPQPESNPNASLANELGLDPEFLANLPEDMQLELIQNEQFRQRNLGGQSAAQQQQQPQREAEQMDIASFIATVTDPGLRREIFANMDEATIATLPPNLMAEARRFQDQMRFERHRARDALENMDRGVRGIFEHLDNRLGGNRFGRADDLFANAFGRRAAGQNREENKSQVGGKPLDEAVTQRHKNLFEEQSNEDLTQQLSHQLSTDEKIIEALLYVLITNEKIECELIPCLQIMIKIHHFSIPVIRNKVVNAITFILKALATNDDETLNFLFPQSQIKKKQSILVLLGCLRLLLKNSRSLMKYILKGLIFKEDQKTSHILKKQQKALKMKQPQLSSMASDSLEDQVITQTKNILQVSPPLAEIFQLIRSEMFKGDKTLMRNLSLLIQQILKQFDIALEEIDSQNQAISPETIQSIAEVLSLDIMDQQLMLDLGQFLFQISKKKRENFDLISDYCGQRSAQLVDKITKKLVDISNLFREIKSRVSPSKMQIMEGYSPSQGGDSVYEEEKNESMIDTTQHPLAEIQKSKSEQIKALMIKLPEEDERHLKQALKLHEDSEILLRIFKLYNLFYEKFSQEKEPKSGEEENKQALGAIVTQNIQNYYTQETISQLVKRVSDILRIVYRTNIDVNESISNLIFCVFDSFYPELYLSIQSEQAKPDESENKKDGKYNIKMLPLAESMSKQEKFTLFRNSQYFNNRIEELSQFCLVNKRIINKLIKQKTSIFVNELEGLIKHMPNLMDFDNKRIYFKRELSKLKKSHNYEQLQLFIRRDDIFMDAYAQLNVRQADEMKGKIHVQFTGERGQDAGGLTRDFFIELSREMFNPNYSLFILSSSGSTYYPNPKSYVQLDHLRYFKFIGRIIGKALLEECLLECYFVKSLYKIMTGEPLTFHDLEDFDNEFYNNLKWCIENDVESLAATFVVEQDYFGRTEEKELIENGRNIAVTNQNKHEYIEKLTYFKLYKSIQEQTDAFLEGFYELIPKELVSMFSYKELELLISGLPNFDITDLRANTEYTGGYSPNSPQVQWLWEVLESFENSERAEFLQFVTGSSKVPLDGFKGLMGMRGPQKFCIAKIKTDDILRLPSGHTCFNQIDLPEYPSKEILHERLLTAIKETKGFGFA